MTDEPDLKQSRALLHEFDLGPLAPLDLDAVIRRGRRRRRNRAAGPWVAGAAAVAILAGAGVATGHLGRSTTPSSVPSVSPTPTPAPPTAAGLLAAATTATMTATGVHVTADLGGGAILDVVVTQTSAQGTLARGGKTSAYVAVGDAVYIKGDALGGSVVQDSQIAAARGRWFLMTAYAPLNDFRNLRALAASFTPNAAPAPGMGEMRDIDGSTAVALVQTNVNTIFVALAAPHLPALLYDNAGAGWAFSGWNATAPIAPVAPDPADVYDPSKG
jgi:hypothetical protein